ncbi:MAG: high-potential iron-sulfur protein [Rubrivivax sp.]|nr:high-potential iron-sulfur protein [Rubrivivax sp.]
MNTRRQFIQILPLAACTVAAAPRAHAQAALVDEKSPQAAALGYVAVASQADKAKFKTYAAGQACGNCALFQGRAAVAAGICQLFAGKQVAAKGRCSAYAKKA